MVHTSCFHYDEQMPLLSNRFSAQKCGRSLTDRRELFILQKDRYGRLRGANVPRQTAE
jgi:hypothetical protein